MTEIEKIEIKGKGRIKYFVYKDENISESDPGPSSFIEVVSFYIKSEFRNQGYGSELVRQLEEIARKEKVSYICAKVNVKEDDILEIFLRKNGFEPSYYQVWEKTIKK